MTARTPSAQQRASSIASAGGEVAPEARAPASTGAVGTTPSSVPADRLARLRKQARRAGFAIRARADRRGAGRRYSLLDETTRSVVASGIADLDALSVELWRLIRERAGHEVAPAASTRPVDTCPGCSTPRLGALRFCRSCGWDYEPERAAGLQPRGAAGRPFGPAAATRPGVSTGSPAMPATRSDSSLEEPQRPTPAARQPASRSLLTAQLVRRPSPPGTTAPPEPGLRPARRLDRVQLAMIIVAALAITVAVVAVQAVVGMLA
jgi:hypothetical protein